MEVNVGKDVREKSGMEREKGYVIDFFVLFFVRSTSSCQQGNEGRKIVKEKGSLKYISWLLCCEFRL